MLTVARAFIVLLLLPLLFGCGHDGHVDLPRDLPRPAVAKLTMAAVDGSGGSCSVFKLTDDLVGTAGHCCLDGEATYTIEPNGIDATVAIDDDTHDVCVMRATMPGVALRIAAHDPAAGEPVWTLGFPHGVPVMSTGYWSGRDGDGQGIVSTTIAGGSSGSPILDDEERIVGVLVAGYRTGDSIGFVATVEHLRHALMLAAAGRH